MSAQVCPVCGGRGLVPRGFYDVSSNLSTTSATPETCRSCGGGRDFMEGTEEAFRVAVNAHMKGGGEYGLPGQA